VIGQRGSGKETNQGSWRFFGATPIKGCRVVRGSSSENWND